MSRGAKCFSLNTHFLPGSKRRPSLWVSHERICVVSVSCLCSFVSEHRQDLDFLPASCLLKTHLVAAVFSLYVSLNLNDLQDLRVFSCQTSFPSALSLQHPFSWCDVFMFCCAGWEWGKIKRNYNTETDSLIWNWAHENLFIVKSQQRISSLNIKNTHISWSFCLKTVMFP